MRVAIGKIHPGKSWISKVIAMSDEEIKALYSKLCAEGKIKGSKKNESNQSKL